MSETVNEQAAEAAAEAAAEVVEEAQQAETTAVVAATAVAAGEAAEDAQEAAVAAQETAQEATEVAVAAGTVGEAAGEAALAAGETAEDTRTEFQQFRDELRESMAGLHTKFDEHFNKLEDPNPPVTEVTVGSAKSENSGGTKTRKPASETGSSSAENTPTGNANTPRTSGRRQRFR